MARDLFGNKKITREDKYTSSKITFTKSDEYWEMFKIFIYLLMGYAYFHFIVMGWTL
tara:strand:+ start:459 stop:629 length:171 start_codon:yes stop_codon:yes gene_type:complete